MSYKDRRTDELIIEDGEKLIILSMEKEKYTGWHTDSGGNIVDEIDRNQIEISYREDDEDGWGVGGDEYLSTCDIKNMADGIRNVIHYKINAFQYSCQNDIFRLKICYDTQSESFSFSVALLETLCRENYIEITKENLSLSALKEYIQPFFEWEKQYPVV
ncbi:MAG: hypothetical protein IJT84_02425 [Clostridia bacterium]|nr:hypothetical protein [Clostridia bacterium]